MSFSIGIVGLPNVGKSTLFKALTKKQVDISAYPFCTISPNVGVVKVPDERLEKLAQVLKPKRILPTTIEFVDIAGLVKGAHQGEGLGNEFLSHIRGVDAILQVVRSFQDENVAHVAGEILPQEDIETVNLELVMKDLATVVKKIGDLRGRANSGDKVAKKILEILEKIKDLLDQGKFASEATLTIEEHNLIKELNLLTLKPMLYVLNVDEEATGADPPPWPGICSGKVIEISAKLEEELAELTDEEAQEYIKELGLKTSPLDELIKTSFQLLNLITFFTCQNEILQAWTSIEGTKAPQAAGFIHTDFTQGFIKAEVISWQDLIKAQSEARARELGLIRTEGKEYVIKDGEVIHFRFKI